jgi:putative hemolysin
MSEIALVSARKGRLESQANKGDEKAKAAIDLIENPEKFLSTAQIGITPHFDLNGCVFRRKIRQ